MMFPSLGVNFEQAVKDKTHSEELSNSGGVVLYTQAGIEFAFRKFSIHAEYQLPVYRNLNAPQPEPQYRLITGLTYAFN